MSNIKPKEATTIINSLQGGVVPAIGLQHILVGRSKESNAVLETIQEVEKGSSSMKFWIGDFGSGKSFMIALIKQIALKKNFVVASTDFSPEKRLYDNTRKAVRVYSDLIGSFSIQTNPEGNALSAILESWIDEVMQKTAEENNIDLFDLRSVENLPLVKRNILENIKQITDVGAFEFGEVIAKYYEGFVTENVELMRMSLKWLRGEYTTKTEARQDLGVREIIDDENYYQMLRNWAKFLVAIGYSGLVINLDEAINLYKIIHPATRDKNYEKILNIYNDCMQGRVSNLMINFGGTKEFLEDTRRGLFSYDALRSRLASNQFETLEVRDYSQPVIKLYPLSNEEIFVLLKNLKGIFDLHYSTNIDFNEADIQSFMEEVYNRPGAKEFLTPRDVIRDFLKILSILRQNPQTDKSHVIKSTDGGNSQGEIEKDGEIELI
jgi:hypothetical protein